MIKRQMEKYKRKMKLYWNYRVIKRKYPNTNEYSLGIYSTYYEKGKEVPHSILSAAIAPIVFGETVSVEELKLELKHMQKALEKPALNYEDF